MHRDFVPNAIAEVAQVGSNGSGERGYTAKPAI